ncbi:MAG: hypothetical protein ACFFCO_04195 [Promethearchaeota archaeon]
MKSILSNQEFLEFLVEGLSQRDLKHVVSHNAFGHKIEEVFITEARELVMLPEGLLEQNTIRWILEIRTPLSIRLTIFTHNVSEFKLRVVQAISELVKDGIDIPNLEHSVSVQELSFVNIQRLLDSLENWRDFAIRGSVNSQPQQKTKTRETTLTSFEHPSFTHSLTRHQGNSVHDVTSSDFSIDSIDHQSLHLNLRNAIKTYWTERYLARYLKTTPEKAREIARRIGVSREVCGREVLYFFNRLEALSKYFSHILKGILDELKIQYEETSQRLFFLPTLCLVVMFFDGNKEQLRFVAEDYARTHDVIFVVPERLRATIGRITDDYFQITPLARDHIFSLLQHTLKNRALITKSTQE